jgi:hypothetical protein
VRRAANTDANHAEMRDYMRKLGCVVEDTHALGHGFPDLVVKNTKGRPFLVEIKNGDLPPSGRKLTPDEVKVAARWGDTYRVLCSKADAMALAFE